MQYNQCIPTSWTIFSVDIRKLKTKLENHKVFMKQIRLKRKTRLFGSSVSLDTCIYMCALCK